MGVVHVPEKQSYDVHRHHTLRMNIASVYTKLKMAVYYHHHHREENSKHTVEQAPNIHTLVRTPLQRVLQVGLSGVPSSQAR